MSQFASQATGTIVLWAVSGTLALLIAVLLVGGTLGRGGPIFHGCSALILVTRGVPTSLLVIAAGIIALRFPAPAWMPNPFPGTSPGMVLVAWAVTIALALGSTGHLAVILREGCLGIGSARLDQLRLLAIPARRRLLLLLGESAPATLAPTGSRLVHHLHNTAFAALFPIGDLFGWVQQRANDTFEVTRYAAIGVAAYVLLSVLIWAGMRGVEHVLVVRRGLGRRTDTAPRPVREREVVA